MRGLTRTLLGVAVFTVVLLGVPTAAQAVNGAECGGDGEWNEFVGSVGVQTELGTRLLPALQPWAEAITCSWETTQDASGAGEAPVGAILYTVALRDFPPEQVGDIMRAILTAPGWVPAETVWMHDSQTGDAGDVSLASFDDVPFDDGQIDRGTRTIDGTGDVYVRYNIGPSITHHWIDDPTLAVVWSGAPLVATGTSLTDPSVLSTLRTIAESIPTPTQTAVIAGSAVVLMLVVAWPSVLLNSVIAARYGRASAAVRERWRLLTRRGGVAPPADSADVAPPRRMPTWLVWIGFALAALISGFIDPAFGLNLMSLRVLVSAVLGFAIFNLGLFMLTRAVARRLQPGSAPRLEFRWGSLGLVLLAVVLARLLGFHPGLVFGLVAGAVYAVALTRTRIALMCLLGAGFALVTGGIAWLLYSVLDPIAASMPGLLVVSEFLSGVTLEGVSTLPIALLPLAALEGRTLFEWKRWAWAGAYAVGLAAFLLVLVTVPGSFGEIPGDYVRWVVIFVAFAAVAVAAWAVHVWLERRAERAATPTAASAQKTDAAPQPGLG